MMLMFTHAFLPALAVIIGALVAQALFEKGLIQAVFNLGYQAGKAIGQWCNRHRFYIAIAWGFSKRNS